MVKETLSEVQMSGMCKRKPRTKPHQNTASCHTIRQRLDEPSKRPSLGQVAPKMGNKSSSPKSERPTPNPRLPRTESEARINFSPRSPTPQHYGTRHHPHRGRIKNMDRQLRRNRNLHQNRSLDIFGPNKQLHNPLWHLDTPPSENNTRTRITSYPRNRISMPHTGRARIHRPPNPDEIRPQTPEKNHKSK
jgi:hypothetical protein